ncbi:hypothetical protein F5Y13DRAFT_149122 [Hypoxylon sp. FL1857]|nr:hypothetical protein F5Y13DRAFT_149122 [Hypoxylon sp. FL1857]
MSTPDKSSRNDGEVIMITLILRPNGPHVSPFPKRQFILSSQTPSIRIGRASKATTKGFVASIDNAWFDSPVMSRQHAELVLDCESVPKTIYIKDIGSLHGTFHTPWDGTRGESRLEQQKPVMLSNGDSLRFGTDIFRGSETFPPCFVDFFMIGQEQLPHNQSTPIVHLPANRVFTIPDDDLDDDDDDDDDDDSVVETPMPPSRKVDAQRGPSIDLTQDETDEADDQASHSAAAAHKNLNSDVIDLTSEPGENSDPEPAAAGRPPSSASLSTPIPALVAAFASCSSNLPTGTDHSQQSTNFENEADGLSDHDLHRHQHDEEMSSEDIRLTDSDDDSIITGDSFDDRSELGEDSDEDEHENVTFGFGNDDHGGLHVWIDEDESLDDLPYSDDASSSSSEGSQNLMSNSSSPAPESSIHSSPNPPVAKEVTSDSTSVEPLADSPDAKRPFVTPFLFTAIEQDEWDASYPRQPSPSDAAMFKSRPMLDRTANDFRAQALGEKSGKYEFFAARESNRTTLVDRLSAPPISAIRETLGENSEQPNAGAEADQNSRPALPLPIFQAGDSHTKPMEEATGTVTACKASPRILGDLVQFNEATWCPLPDPPCPTWSVSGEKFINNPRNEDFPYPCLERPPSPELDMTSAYAFQLSKMATESSANQRPRRVGIEDLLTQEPRGIQSNLFGDEHHVTAAPTPSAPVPLANSAARDNGLKRSFEDAFSDSHAEPDVQPNSDGAHTHLSETKSDAANHQSQSAAVCEDESSRIPPFKITSVPPQDGADVIPVTVLPRPDNIQPSKRRRFAQAAACVALGGAAAFTFMVSTAPVL